MRIASLLCLAIFSITVFAQNTGEVCEVRMRAIDYRQLFPIHSQRLTLRLSTYEDRELIRPLLRDEEILAKSLLIARLPEGTYYEDRILDYHLTRGMQQPDWQDDPKIHMNLIVFDRANGSMIGLASLARYLGHDHWSLGFSVAEQFRNQGFAREMIRALVARVRERDSNAVIWAQVLHYNGRSIRVLENTGFVHREWAPQLLKRPPDAELFELRQ